MVVSKKITDVLPGELLVQKTLEPEGTRFIAEHIIELVEKSIAQCGDCFMVSVSLDVRLDMREKSAASEVPMKMAV